MISIRRSADRGSTRLDWLQSRHTFSFGHYHDPQHMGVSALRVINDDEVVPGGGFETHSHRDMEIISYVQSGVIEHRDSMGNIERLPVGEFQLMSAGTGVTHSEYNPSATESLKFLQIWVMPNEIGIEPGYQQKRFPRTPARQLILSPDGRDGSMTIHQDTFLEQLILNSGDVIDFSRDKDRIAYLHVITGRLILGDAQLQDGDGATITDTAVALSCCADAEALLFDLPRE